MALPRPEPGLVINYAYLWHREYAAGAEEGRKDRPAVVVLALSHTADGTTIITVLPITHSAPADHRFAVEIPIAVKQNIGLDESRSWILVEEGNEFVWPGHDLRRRPGTDRYDYGFLPPRLFEKVQAVLFACHRSGRAKTVPRS